MLICGGIDRIGSLSLLFLGHKAKFVLFVAEESQNVVVILPQGRSVTHSDQRNIALFHVGVEVSFNVNGDGTGAFVEDCIERSVVNETSHGHALFFSSRKHIVPVVD